MGNKVILAYPWHDANGKAHTPDSTLDVDEDVAVQLVQDGKARWSDGATADQQGVKATTKGKE